ncbi:MULTISPECIES: YidC/Oxa1 family membrane protein insertase [Synergistaceae]|uniref:YidC/Oxa1 family membrane protein insertase n=1 Tax=Synergistaceae TaxID=649777 RepID=UPI003AE55F57|nr:YidC/Oxa1 family membrane protein insertase [Synergistaceae bacterium DZ-S4]
MGAIWNGASDLLLMILEFFYGLTNSFGMAIVLLTIAVRIALYPLNQKQMVSMQQMQKIQPRLKVLQEKYANDKEKLNQETMRLYKENKINPAAGCLPLLVQLPILILLFNVLRTYDFAGTSFLGIILGSSTTAGLAQAVGVAADPTGNYGLMSVLTGIMQNPSGLSNAGLYMGNLILLISISFLTWAQQKLSSAGANPQMAMMNTIMPFFMAFICLSMPGGVMLYWGLSSLIGVAQQYFVMKKTKEELQVKPVLHKNKPTPAAVEDDDDEYEDDYDDDDDE